jgi:nitroreductase
MELSEIMRTQHACRYFRSEPVPEEVLWRAVELARFAPNGGNRNAVRLVIVRDPRIKLELGALYLPLWRDVTAAVRSGQNAMTTATGHRKSTQLGFSNPERALADGDHFAEHFGRHPLIIVVCVDIAETHPTDTELDRLSIVGGASVYPFAQNLCLALRSVGVATSLTTLLVAREPDVKRLLGIPDHLSTACHIAAGYPERPFPTRLRRATVSEIAFVDAYGRPLELPRGADADDI